VRSTTIRAGSAQVVDGAIQVRAALDITYSNPDRRQIAIRPNGEVIRPRHWRSHSREQMRRRTGASGVVVAAYQRAAEEPERRR
jgi:hypothetical protein